MPARVAMWIRDSHMEISESQAPAQTDWEAAVAQLPDHRRRRLGIIVGVHGYRWQGGVHLHASIGRIVDQVAQHFQSVTLCIPLTEGQPQSSADHRVTAPHLHVVPVPGYRNSLQAIAHLPRIWAAYWQTIRSSDALLVRGIGTGVLACHVPARVLGRRVVQWMVGDPVALLRSHRRRSAWRDRVSLLGSLAYQTTGQVCIRFRNVVSLVNGEALGRIYHSPRTVVTASSTLRRTEIHPRADACTGPVVRILFASFLRPEKGAEYLLEALSRLHSGRAWELIVAGSQTDIPAYRTRLENLIRAGGIANRIQLVGHRRYGDELFTLMRSCDLLVLPTLSEGTPHVLIDARGNGLPVIASRVGGVPTMIAHEVNGLLVPPKDPDALAVAIDRVIEDGALRRRLIAEGLKYARQHTVEAFAAEVAWAALCPLTADGQLAPPPGGGRP